MESGLTLICPACDGRTPFRRVHDDPGTTSVLWTCGSCGFAWDASPLEVHAIGRPPWAADRLDSGRTPASGSTPPRAA